MDVPELKEEISKKKEESVCNDAESVAEGEVNTKKIREECFEKNLSPRIVEEEYNKINIINIKKFEEKRAEDKKVSKEASSSKKKKANFKVWASKRLIWKHEELDPKTSEMYEEVLNARKGIYNLKTKNKRRFTRDGKLLCLSIYKRSAATYRYLGTFLPLPSPMLVNKLLTQIRLDTGVTQTMKDLLKDAARRMTDELDKVCVLMWHEVSLKLHLQYSARKAKIIDFEDWGTNRTNKYADHALVFMLRGIKNGWKIPLTYIFCGGQTTHEQLAWCIKDVARAVTAAGFNIAATIDTDKVREEKKISQYWTILTGNVEIIPLYDPPHILKCITNNLLTKNLEFEMKAKAAEEERWFANWDHVIKAYLIDLYSPRKNRMVPDLMDEHVYLDKINKMCVNLMMQVFSKKLSNFMDLLSRSPRAWDMAICEILMPPEAWQTVYVLQYK
ncbi:uncharacterized protein LOC117182711 [Belonocnema kinseyi]|uniref:uncharacterized protein LOC117182711 n=1 Tax=Belonocnema kinseyi TaxID=2817044 RepID=UPI00143D2E27|nr:uncharacterized protein LOC117182711 [Belonocnema kinseyi]